MVHQHIGKVFYCCGNIQWVLTNSGGRGGAQKTGIIHPGRKVSVEIDAYEDPKFISTICSNDNEAKKMEWYTLAKVRGLNNVASNIILDDVLLYGGTAKQLLDYFRTVLDVLKHHCTILKVRNYKKFQDR